MLSEKIPTARKLRMVKTGSKGLLAILMVVAGTMHFLNSDFLMKIMPPDLPRHRELVYFSGLCEIGLGLLLFVPRFSRLAAWGIIALLIAVFPANIYAFQHQDVIPAPPILHLLRLPLQAVLILWAYWHTRRATSETKTTGRESNRSRSAPAVQPKL